MGFHLVLDGVGECGEEVDAGNALYLVDGVVVEVSLLVALGISDDDAEGFGGALQTEHDLEEGFGDSHGIVANGGVPALHPHRTADNIYLAILACPLAAVHLQAVPQAAVELGMLRTDVEQREGVVHGCPIPLVVACGTHVTARPSAASIVLGGGAGQGTVVVVMEVAETLQRAVGMGCRELPRHPVGTACLWVIGGDVGRALQDDFGGFLQGCCRTELHDAVGHGGPRHFVLRGGSGLWRLLALRLLVREGVQGKGDDQQHGHHPYRRAVVFFLSHIQNDWLCVDGSTLRATAFLSELGTTLSATVGIVGMAPIAPQGEGDVEHKEEVADVVEGEDAEDHVDHGTHGGKTGEVEQRIEGGQLVAHIVEDGDSHDDDGPHGGDEEAEVEGQRKGVQRGMEIIVTPRLGTKHLDGGVEGGGHGDEDAQQGGIGGVDVVEVDDVGTAAQQFAHGIGASDEHADGEEDEEVGVGEDVDELRDGVVGGDTLQEFALTNPPLRNLVVRHLDPHGVDGVGRYHADVGNDDAVAMDDIEGVERHVGQRVGQRQAVGSHHEVVVLRIVVSGGEGDGVYLMLGEIPGIWRLLATVVAGRQKNA